MLGYLLIAMIVADAIGVVSGIIQFQLLNDFKAGKYADEAIRSATADTNDFRQSLVGGLQFILFVITTFVFAKWIYRTATNVRAFGAQGLKYSPGWAVGGYFIPFINLVMPYQAMKEIWRASKNPENWPTEKRGSILPWWWFLFWVNNFLGQTVLRLTMSAETLDQILGSTMAGIMLDLTSIVATPVALRLVRQITEFQRVQSQRLNLTDVRSH